MMSLTKNVRPGKRTFLSVLLILAVFSFCEAFTAGTYDMADRFFFADRPISASYFGRSYTITASAGTGGSISPLGEVKVKRDGKVTFTISANPGYEILDVVVDGESQGAIATYKFSKVKSNHTISAAFYKKTYTLTASAGEGGNISPSGEVSVAYGSDQTYTISANPGYEVLDVEVDGESQGALPEYTFTEISSDHSIFVTFNRRVIEVLNVIVPNSSMKIGDVVPVTITLDAEGERSYTLLSGSVGGYPLLGFQRISATSYRADFSITPGGNSFTASQDIPVSNLVISDGEVLSASYNLPIMQNSDPIDAHAPVVIHLEVPSMEVGVGNSFKVTVTADAEGYTAGPGTVVNGVPLSSSRVTFTELLGGLYELSYRVAIEDAPVAPGMLELSMVLLDQAGNVGDSYSSLALNTLEIYTTLPEAALAGSSEICEGEVAELTVLLSGRPPWNFELDDGTNTTNYTNITSSAYQITVSPVQTTTHQISSVTDVNGVENTETKEVQVKVYEDTDVEIINLATGYSVDADPVELQANVPGGMFSGRGVIRASGIFYPSLADTLLSPHTIYYSYTNDKGCTSTTSKLVFVMGSNAAILIPDNAVCANEDPFTASVLNVAGSTGTFRLLDSSAETVPGLSDHGDNTATIDPAALSSESYTIEYQYFDLEIHHLRKTFSVESVSVPEILGLDESAYCQSLAPVELQSNLANVLFDGPGVTGNVNDGFTFTPGEASPGDISIFCTSYSEHGCTETTQKSIHIAFSPEVKFELSSACIPEGGEIVSFDNQTNGKASIETWSWEFGDPASGEENQSKLIDPTHFYSETGPKSITLSASTFEGCVATYMLDSIIDSKPEADFTWMSECFIPGSDVKFVNRTDYGLASVDTSIWTFKTGGGHVLGEIVSISSADTVSFPFTEANSYLVDLYTKNTGGCLSELSKEITLRPTIQLEGEGYTESFDATEGLWTVHSEDQMESWVWDVPDFNGHTLEAGNKAWFTRLPSGLWDYSENSWIQSPCYDLREVDRPMIQMDIMRSFVPNQEGAVLQYQDLLEGGWKTVGEQTPGIGWYNATNILNKPGGSSKGWGLVEFQPDSEWVTAVHDLDQVSGNPNVVFRVAIATNGNQGMDNQGFAFDNVRIAERSKIAVLEHFTDNSYNRSRMADDLIDAFVNKHSKDVIDLQYHMSSYGMDPMYMNNPDPSSTRSFNYGVPQVPYTVLDGGIHSYHRYEYSNLKSGPVEDQVLLLTLEEPKFNIELSVNWLGSSLEATTIVNCATGRFEENIQLYLVVFETSVTAYTGGNGDTHFRNVVLDMLPTPGGKLLGNNWYAGKSDVRTYTWNYKPYVEDIEDLAVAAFVQDRNSGQIIQAAVEYKTEMVGLLNSASQLRSLNIYPNPANSTLNVNLGARTEYSGKVELLDMNGKVVLSEHVPAGYQVFQLDIDHLNRGMYILRWFESELPGRVSKFVKTQ